MKGSTLVYYVFQHEESNEYNICKIKADPTAPQIKVKHVIKSFPFNALSGQYHFRFKSEFKESGENIIGWIDIINVNSKAPMFNNSVYVKILKLKSPLHNRILNSEKLQKIREPTPVKKISHTPSPPPHPKPQPINEPIKKEPHHSHSVDLFDLDIKPSPIKKENNINQIPHQNNTNLFMLDGAGNAANNNSLSNQSEKPKPKIQDETAQQKIRRAQQNWLHAENKQKAEQQAAIELDDKILKWAQSMKTRNNFRTLLVTVHEIWPYGKWEPVDLGKLLTDNQLKKYYKKAMLVFHPDQNQHKPAQQQYLAKRIFSEINAAFGSEIK